MSQKRLTIFFVYVILIKNKEAGHREGVQKMPNRKEIESLIGKMTDEQWNTLCAQFATIEQEEWERTHPLDD